MIILLYRFCVEWVVPRVGAFASALVEPVVVVTIALAGLGMICGSVGLWIFDNLGTTVVSGLLRAVGYIGRSLIQGIAWVLRRIFHFLSRVFNESRRAFGEMGMKTAPRNLLAALVTLLVAAVII